MLKKRNIITSLPYKTVNRGRPLVEDVDNAVKQFGGSKYDMILVAIARARQLSLGAVSTITTEHKPTVTAILEIEAGLFKHSDYFQN